MSKKSRRADKGTYALFTSIGLFAGIGMAPMVNNGLYPALIGLALGFAAAHFLVRKKQK